VALLEEREVWEVEKMKEINLSKLVCPICKNRKFVHVEYTLFHCDNCEENFSFVAGEWLKEKRVNGELIYVTLESSIKSPFSYRNLPTKSRKLIFGFY